MFGAHFPSIHLPRGRPAVLLAAAFIVLVCLIGPARGLASVTQWTPANSGLAQTSRACPEEATAAYYNTSCWTVQQDQTNPLYSPHAPYPWGQCTYWALEMRPDIWNNQSASDPNGGDWTAYTWPQHAALEGLTVDHVPAAGAIVVWPQSNDNSTGHVAYVQSVSVNPTSGQDFVTLQEMNDTTFDDPSQGQGDTMTMSMDSGDLAGVQFIHVPTGVPVSPTTTTTSTSSAAPTQPTTPTQTTTTSKTTTIPTEPTKTKGRGTNSTAVTAGQRTSPRLLVRLGSEGLKVSSASPAPLHATVQRLPSGTIVSRSRLRAGSALRLPTGRYRVCVSQAAQAAWQSARACVLGTEPSVLHHRTIRTDAFGRPRVAPISESR